MVVAALIGLVVPPLMRWLVMAVLPMTKLRLGWFAFESQWLWGALGGALSVALIWALRNRSRKRALRFPEMPLPALEAIAAAREMTGPQAALIVQQLQALSPSELSRIQTNALLSSLSKAGGQLREIDPEVIVRGWLTVTEASESGLIRERQGTLSLVPEGRRRLVAQVPDDVGQRRDRFVSERLGESLLVTCPICGAALAAMWLQPTLDCPSCHHRFPIHQSPFVRVEAR
jgi:hypothetical protein